MYRKNGQKVTYYYTNSISCRFSFAINLLSNNLHCTFDIIGNYVKCVHWNGLIRVFNTPWLLLFIKVPHIMAMLSDYETLYSKSYPLLKFKKTPPFIPLISLIVYWNTCIIHKFLYNFPIALWGELARNWYQAKPLYHLLIVKDSSFQIPSF